MNANYCTITFSTQLPYNTTNEDIIDACLDVFINIFGNTFDIIIMNNNIHFMIYIISKNKNWVDKINYEIIKCIEFLPILIIPIKVIINTELFINNPKKLKCSIFKVKNEIITDRYNNYLFDIIKI